MAIIETIPNWPYSKVDDRCLQHDGVIVDVGCLGWNWSQFFIGKKRVIGVDPQENPIKGTELFKGILCPFDGIVRLYGSGEGANLTHKKDGGVLCDAISWSSFCSKFKIDKISVLKLNIEGSEYPLLHSLTTDDFAKIDQIAVSFHDWYYPNQSAVKYSSLELLKKVGFEVEPIYLRWGWYLAKKLENV